MDLSGARQSHYFELKTPLHLSDEQTTHLLLQTKKKSKSLYSSAEELSVIFKPHIVLTPAPHMSLVMESLQSTIPITLQSTYKTYFLSGTRGHYKKIWQTTNRQIMTSSPTKSSKIWLWKRSFILPISIMQPFGYVISKLPRKLLLLLHYSNLESLQKTPPLTASISLLPVLGKILEKIILKRITTIAQSKNSPVPVWFPCPPCQNTWTSQGCGYYSYLCCIRNQKILRWCLSGRRKSIWYRFSWRSSFQTKKYFYSPFIPNT